MSSSSASISSNSSSSAFCLDDCLERAFGLEDEEEVDCLSCFASLLNRSSSEGPPFLEVVAFSLPLSFEVATGEAALELEADLEVFLPASSSALEALRLSSVFWDVSADLLVSLLFPLSLLSAALDVEANVPDLLDLPDYSRAGQRYHKAFDFGNSSPSLDLAYNA